MTLTVPDPDEGRLSFGAVTFMATLVVRPTLLPLDAEADAVAAAELLDAVFATFCGTELAVLAVVAVGEVAKVAAGEPAAVELKAFEAWSVAA